MGSVVCFHHPVEFGEVVFGFFEEEVVETVHGSVAADGVPEFFADEDAVAVGDVEDVFRGPV